MPIRDGDAAAVPEEQSTVEYPEDEFDAHDETEYKVSRKVRIADDLPAYPERGAGKRHKAKRMNSDDWEAYEEKFPGTFLAVGELGLTQLLPVLIVRVAVP